MSAATSKKNNNKRRTPQKQAASSKKRISKEVLISIGVAVGIFLELCCLNIFGIFGGWIKYALFGLFGIMAYALPALIIVCFLFFCHAQEGRISKIIFTCVIFLCLCVMLQMLSAGSEQGLLNSFTYCAENLKGGGITGALFAVWMPLLFSTLGTYVILILLICFCDFMIIRKPLISAIKGENKSKADDLTVYEKPAKPKKDGQGTAGNQKQSRRGRGVSHNTEIEDEEIYRVKREDGSVVRIVKAPKRKKTRAALVRAGVVAPSLRDGSVKPVSGNPVRGVADATLIDNSTDPDIVKEITDFKYPEPEPPAVSENISDTQDSIPIKPGGVSVKEVGTSVIPGDFEGNKQNNAGAKSGAESDAQSRIIPNASESAVSRDETKVKRWSPGKKAETKEPGENKSSSFALPATSLLGRKRAQSEEQVSQTNAMAKRLEEILYNFGVHARVINTQTGPAVTRFELQPELGTKVSKVTSLSDDLMLNLAVTDIRIEAPIPGKAAIGIEIPNKTRQVVSIRELLESDELRAVSSKIAFAAGKDISGNVVVADIAKMPHLLVAGTTGSGKSTFLNSIIMCILYRATPEDVGLIIIDPKRIEFGIYAGIPHLMKNVVTDPGQAVSTLRWAVSEMTNRYQRMQLSGVRDFKAYNEKLERGLVSAEEENPKKMQQIVIVIDELADLMMVAAKEAESLICRLAQLARAAGIHLVIATQRPSVDVVTGLIKANIPARAALLVASGVDSRTIIDMNGAEKLLGYGDMLFFPPGAPQPIRVQGAYVSDKEIQDTVKFLIQNKNNDYYAKEQEAIDEFVNNDSKDAEDGNAAADDSSPIGRFDECFYDAGKACISAGKASASMLQRRLNVGFNRAARILDQLYEFGVIGPENGSKPREVLVDELLFEKMCKGGGQNF